MWRMINFFAGFIVGIVIGASIGLLVTPHSSQELRTIFQQEFAAKKAELESQLLRLPETT